MLGVEYFGPQWFVLIVEAGCDRQIENGLAARGYRPFVPRVKRWVTHARVKTAKEAPLLGRYVFCLVDYPTQSFARAMDLPGVQGIISVGGIPAPIRKRDVDDLFERYLAGEFDQTRIGIPVGARVAIVKGAFEDMLATVTGRSRGMLELQVLGRRDRLRASERNVRPAFGYDLKRAAQ